MNETGYKKILDVDLSTGKVVKTDIDPEFTRKYMGGMGFSNKILYDEVGPDVDPLSPENIVVFAPGTFSGSQIPGTCRTEITTKHPQTGNIGTGNTGGVWGVHLKRAGIDVLVVRNKAEKPVYLWIDNDKVEIREASHLWGKDTYETTGILEQETELPPKVGIIAIGQAGENLVSYACPITDRHHGANRTGAGAVMGAKKLKAIAVRGTGVLRPARPEEFKKAVMEMNERQEVNRKAAMMPNSYSGTGGGLRRYIEEGGLRVKNFSAGFLPDFLETRGNREINRRYDSGRKSCNACPAQCFQISEV
ncbi:aldehyde ferredoxin oxidoreductase N-terminal domain-containing protein, partial [Chloroflexota bacterium]